MQEEIYSGNAFMDSINSRGWFVGSFITSPETLPSDAGEVKWGLHAAGEKRDIPSLSPTAHTLDILLDGQITVSLPHKDVILEKLGDYVLWGPNIPHTWRLEENSLSLTICWPSNPPDIIEVTPEKNEQLFGVNL